MHTHENRGHILFFGGLTVAGVAAALYQWYLTMKSPLPWLLPLTIGFGVIGICAVALGVFSYILAFLAWKNDPARASKPSLLKRISRRWNGYHLRRQLTDLDWLVANSLRSGWNGSHSAALATVSHAFASLTDLDSLLVSINHLRQLDLIKATTIELPDPRALLRIGPLYGLVYFTLRPRETPDDAERRLGEEKRLRLGNLPLPPENQDWDTIRRLDGLMRKGRTIESEIEAREGRYNQYEGISNAESADLVRALTGDCAEWRSEVTEALPHAFTSGWSSVAWKSGVAETPSLVGSVDWLLNVILMLRMPLRGNRVALEIHGTPKERLSEAKKLALFRRELRIRAGLPLPDLLADLKRQLAGGIEFQQFIEKFKPESHTEGHEDYAVKWQAETSILLSDRQQEGFDRDPVFRAEPIGDEVVSYIDIRPSIDYLKVIVDALEAQQGGMST